EALRQISEQRFGVAVVRSHGELPSIIDRCHRFRATDLAGLFALAKDLARITADLFDAEALNSIAGFQGKEKRGSLKALEAVVAMDTGGPAARAILGPLFGIYELRLGDAHLPKNDQEEAFRLVGVDMDMPPVKQGYHILHACVAALTQIA